MRIPQPLTHGKDPFHGRCHTCKWFTANLRSFIKLHDSLSDYGHSSGYRHYESEPSMGLCKVFPPNTKHIQSKLVDRGYIRAYRPEQVINMYPKVDSHGYCAMWGCLKLSDQEYCVLEGSGFEPRMASIHDKDFAQQMNMPMEN